MTGSSTPDLPAGAPQRRPGAPLTPVRQGAQSRPQPAGRPRRSPPARTGGEAIVDCAIYVEGRRYEVSEPHDALREAERRGGFVWLGLLEPSEQELGVVADCYGLHPLAVEDAVFAHQRPKLERYDDDLFMVLKTATYVEHEQLTATSEVVDTGEVMVFLGCNYVITVRHGEHGRLHELRQGLEQQHDLLCLGPSAILYAIADHVIDGFVEVAGLVEDDVEELETSVFSSERSDDIGRIYQLKRELLQLRRAVSPLEAPLQRLVDRQVDVVPDQMRAYFRDVQDHAIRVREQVTALDELLTSILQAALALTSKADNEDMRRISAWAGIIAVPTAIAGIYGMNFHWIPELAWHWGYPAVMLLMALICLLLYRGFKRNGWL